MKSLFVYNYCRSVSDRECWDTAYRWRDVKADESSDNKCTTEDDIVHMEYQRDPEEPIKELPETQEDEKHLNSSKVDTKNEVSAGTKSATNVIGRGKDNKYNEVNKFDNRQNIINEIKCKVEQTPPFHNVQLRKVEPQREHTHRNSSPANKDFDYIKGKPNNVIVKPKYAVDPIVELKNMPRRESNASDDDPPFNFQAMLRKTNLRRDSRDSLKNALQAARRFSLTKGPGDFINGISDEEPIKSKLISMEISPGIFIEGHETEL